MAFLIIAHNIPIADLAIPHPTTILNVGMLSPFKMGAFLAGVHGRETYATVEGHDRGAREERIIDSELWEKPTYKGRCAMTHPSLRWHDDPRATSTPHHYQYSGLSEITLVEKAVEYPNQIQSRYLFGKLLRKASLAEVPRIPVQIARTPFV